MAPRKPKFRTLLFWIALFLSELGIVFQHQKLSSSIQAGRDDTPAHDFPSWFPFPLSRYAYAFLITDCNPAHPEGYRGIVFSILVNVQRLESLGSKADIVVMVRMSSNSKMDVLPFQDVALLNAYPRVSVHYLPNLPKEISAFHTSQLVEKFRILDLTQYRRVMYLDSDLMPLCNLDYLFHLSDKGVLKENVVVTGSDKTIYGGFMLLRPGAGEYHYLLSLIEKHDQLLSMTWKLDRIVDWGRSSVNKHGLTYFWVKHVKKSVSVFNGDKVEQWSTSAVKGSIPVLDATLVDVMNGNGCQSQGHHAERHERQSYNLIDQFWHFDEPQAKFWMVASAKDHLSSNKMKGPIQVWFQTLNQVKMRLNLTVEFSLTLTTPPSSTLKNADKQGEGHLSSNGISSALPNGHLSKPSNPNSNRKSVSVLPRIGTGAADKKYAYAFVLAGVDPEKPKGYRGILFSILVTAEALESSGSEADIVVLVQMSYESKSDYLPKEDTSYLRGYPKIVVHYIPRPSEPHSFYSAQFDKFRVLELIQYSRVIYMDADVLPLCNIDYLFHMSEKGIFKENMLLAGNNEPSNGGFMMLRPRKGDYDQVVQIIEARDAHILATSPNHTFDTLVGWGHVIRPPDKWRTRYNRKTGTRWDFATAYGNQGLMFYWTKYVKKDVSIFLGNEVDNWSSSSDPNQTTPVLEATLVDAIKGHECPTRMDFQYDKLAKAPYDLEGQLLHFWGKYRKPWMLENTNKVMKGKDPESPSYRVWFGHFDRVKKRLNITLNINKHLRSEAALGSWTTEESFVKSLQRKHAYAFLLVDVDPAEPTKYRATMFSILVNVLVLEFFGSTADVVVMVQMAHTAEQDTLPETDVSYLKKCPNVVIHYLPKAVRAHTFYTAQFEKFRILELTKYRRVLYMDADYMPLCSLDYLFYLSEKGTFKENMILAGNDEPAMRGFMMLRPGMGEYQQLMSIVDKRDGAIWESFPNLTFDEVVGWGHYIMPPDQWRSRYNLNNGTRWNFTASFGDQGLLYHWVKYVKKSASIFIGNEVENWSSSSPRGGGGERTAVLEGTLIDALKGHECSTRLRFPHDEHTKPPYDMEGQVWHFDGADKMPWNLKNVTNVLAVDEISFRPYHMWFEVFRHLRRRLSISLDAKKKLRYNPKLVPSTMEDDFKKSLERRHAYAFVLAGVSPEHPEQHSGNLFSILVNAERFESWGSNADIVVLVQMAHDSEWDYLPKEILRYIQAYPNIVVHYLPKPSKPPSFHSSQFDKFQILELTQYRRVIYLDDSVLPLCNLDYLFHFSERGVFKENMVLAGNSEPSNGAFMMLRPRAGEYQDIKNLIYERDSRRRTSPNKSFDEVVGWGHVIQPPDHWRTRYNRSSGTLWNFTTAFGYQGLTYFWAKYVKKSVSLFLGNEVENWGPPVNSSGIGPVLETTLVDAIQGHECPSNTLFPSDMYRKAPFDLEGQMRQFIGLSRKPWMIQNVTHVLHTNDRRYLDYQLWFKAFVKVKRRLKIKVSLKELRRVPQSGSTTKKSEILARLERKFG